MFANLLLGVLTISAAFSVTSLAKILHGNDISYGIYIYHMLVVNVVVTVIISTISWEFIEKKALLLKYKS